MEKLSTFVVIKKSFRPLIALTFLITIKIYFKITQGFHHKSTRKNILHHHVFHFGAKIQTGLIWWPGGLYQTYFEDQISTSTLRLKYMNIFFYLLMWIYLFLFVWTNIFFMNIFFKWTYILHAHIFDMHIFFYMHTFFTSTCIYF